MLFSQNEQGDKKSPKKQSILGFLFRPKFGDDVSPIADNLRMFIRLIMYILASQNLFPKDHPAYLDERAPLSLRDLLSISYGRLSFTKQGLPQVLLFFAVVGCFVCSLLFVLIFILSLLVSSAHAASMFTAPGAAGSCDLALNWISYLFMDGSVSSGAGCTNPVMAPNGQGVQRALRAGLALYSSAVLVFAGFILLYHLASMIAETAYSGVAMGKRANQIWAPIRLVVAIGLLIPIGAGAGGAGSGLNTAQFLAIQMARWGSGLASFVWQGFLAELTTDMNKMTLVIPAPPYVEPMVKQIIMLDACRQTYNQVMSTTFANARLSAQISKYSIRSPYIMQPVCDVDSINGTYVYEGCGPVIRYSNADENGILQDGSRVSGTGDLVSCGSIELPIRPRDVGNADVLAISHAVYDANVAIIKALTTNSDLQSIAQAAFSKLNPVYSNGITPISDEQAVTMTKKLVADVSKEISVATAAALGGTRSDNTWTTNLDSLSTRWSDQGWVMAGAWFNTIARAQGNVFDQAQTSLDVKISPPALQYGNTASFLSRANPLSYVDASHWWSTKSGSGQLADIDTIVGGALNRFGALVKSSNQNDGEQLAATGTDAKSNISMNSAASGMLTALDWLGKKIGLWPENGGLAIKFGDKANPLAELAAAGYRFIAFGFDIITSAGLGNLVAGLAGLSGIVGPLLGLCLTIGAAFVMMGIMLAFYVPLLPFIKFFFNVLSWILVVFEAVVSAPLFALAHLTPYGDGLPGGMAQKGYFMLLSIFLRPVLLVFGLIAGLLIFFIGIHFLNAAFGIAAAGVGATNGGLAVMSKIVYSLLYGAFAYICANTSFKAISFFAEHGMGWMSAQGSSAPGMGHAGEMGRAMGFATAYMGDKLAGNLGGAAKGAGDDVRAIQRRGMDKKAVEAQGARDNVQSGILSALTGAGGGGGGGGGQNQLGNMGSQLQPSEPETGGAGGTPALPASRTNETQMPQSHAGADKEELPNNPLLSSSESGPNRNSPTIPDRAMGRDQGFNDEQMMKLEKLRLEQMDKDRQGPTGA